MLKRSSYTIRSLAFINVYIIYIYINSFIFRLASFSPSHNEFNKVYSSLVSTTITNINKEKILIYFYIKIKNFLNGSLKLKNRRNH